MTRMRVLWACFSIASLFWLSKDETSVGWFLSVHFPISAYGFLKFVSTVPQDPTYHQFADRRCMCGIPNTSDVCSNLGFLVAGIVGFTMSTPSLDLPWMWFFVGSMAVCIGSMYYHWNPTNATLVWDRLPMTVCFMALFSIILGEHIGGSEWMLWPLLMLGIASVFYWQFTDDLRPYILVQFYPLLVIPFLLHRSEFSKGHLVAGLIWYALAKIAEYLDHSIWTWTNHRVSGHTIKHLLASCTVWECIMFKYRN